MSTLVRLLGAIYIIASFILSCYIFNTAVLIEQLDTPYYYGNYETEQDYTVNGTAIAVGIGVLFQGVFFGASALCIASTKDKTDAIYSILCEKDKAKVEETAGISEMYKHIDDSI